MWFSTLPHAAPAPAPLFSRRAGASTLILVLHAQAAQRDTDATAYRHAAMISPLLAGAGMNGVPETIMLRVDLRVRCSFPQERTAVLGRCIPAGVVLLR